MSLRRQQRPCYAIAVPRFPPLLLLCACVSEQEPPAAAPDPPPASRWAQATVPSLSAPEGGCPDEDGDGFPSAWICPGLPADQADCNDTDPGVTPRTERFVRPGPFVMGDGSQEAGWDERPVHPVFLSGYCLDRTEVAAGPYAEWLRRATDKLEQHGEFRDRFPPQIRSNFDKRLKEAWQALKELGETLIWLTRPEG